MQKWRWIDRAFQFDSPAAKFPEHLERLRGTPARIEDRVRGLPRPWLTESDSKGWTIQENIGHLLELEELQFRRIDELLAGAVTLSAADMGNRATHKANHNARNTDGLLADFRSSRAQLVARFEALDEVDWERSSIHPRLAQPMRIVDLAFFNAEHDDYHLARISELIRTFQGRP